VLLVSSSGQQVGQARRRLVGNAKNLKDLIEIHKADPTLMDRYGKLT
jgi:hypothetical protein